MKLKASCFEIFCFPSPTESGVEEDEAELLWLELLDEELWEDELELLDEELELDEELGWSQG